jgi:hypothetical protein
VVDTLSNTPGKKAKHVIELVDHDTSRVMPSGVTEHPGGIASSQIDPMGKLSQRQAIAKWTADVAVSRQRHRREIYFVDAASWRTINLKKAIPPIAQDAPMRWCADRPIMYARAVSGIGWR